MKDKRTVHEHCILVDKIISHGGTGKQFRNCSICIVA